MVNKNLGFTLIELSIVLVIIGLIVGGILVGQDLIKGAEIRAQISQIEKYNSAVRTFQNKYGGIPGDLNITLASQFGFVTTNCNGQMGRRDGNGLIDGYATSNMYAQLLDETGLFWQDLSTTDLIDGSYPPSNSQTVVCNTNGPNLVATTVNQYFPTAKLGYGNYIYVYDNNGFNWYSISAITAVNASVIVSNANIPVQSAYNIDKKIDDGIATTGNVVAVYINNSNTSLSLAPNTSIAGGNATSCYDTTTNNYSTSVSNGTNPNCALSFKFQ